MTPNNTSTFQLPDQSVIKNIKVNLQRQVGVNKSEIVNVRQEIDVIWAALENVFTTTIKKILRKFAIAHLHNEAENHTEECFYCIEFLFDLWTTVTECFRLTSSAGDCVECDGGVSACPGLTTNDIV